MKILNFLKSLMGVVVAWLLKHSEVSHAVIAGLVVIFFALIIAPILSVFGVNPALVHFMPWLGVAVAVFYYLGREKRDAEIAAGGPQRKVWYVGIFPKSPDFLAPLISAPVVALLIVTF